VRLLTFGKRNLRVEDIRIFDLRFFPISHCALAIALLITMDAGVAFEESFGAWDFRREEEPRLENQRWYCYVWYAQRDGHSDTVTNTAELTTLRGEHLAYVDQLEHVMRTPPVRCNLLPHDALFPNRICLPVYFAPNKLFMSKKTDTKNLRVICA